MRPSAVPAAPRAAFSMRGIVVTPVIFRLAAIFAAPFNIVYKLSA